MTALTGQGPGRGVVLAIDFGSRTTVGVLTDGGPRLVGVDGQPWTQSAVYADAGGLVVGTDAVRLARLDPTRFEPSPKRRIDDGEVLLGTTVISVSTLIDAVIGRVVDETRRQLGGRPIDGLVLTHPAQWSNVRQNLLRHIGERYAPRLVLVPEPVAAAMYFAATTGFSVGSTLAVYDLGAGTFDAAVVRRSPQGFEVLACDGIADLGGIDMDQRLFDHVGAKAQAQNAEAWAELTGDTAGSAESRRRLRALRDDISSAKETLSRRLEIDIPFPNPFTDVHVTRAEYEDLIRADVERSVDVLAATIAAAGVTAQSLDSIHFVGGASRTPLCAELISQRLGVQPVPIDQPETVVALGGVRAILPAQGQVQAQSGRTGTYAADLGSGSATGNIPLPGQVGGPPTGTVPVPGRPTLLPGLAPRPPLHGGPPGSGPPRTRPVVPPATGPAPSASSGRFGPTVQRGPTAQAGPPGPPTGSHRTIGTGAPPPAPPARKSKKVLYIAAAATAVVVAVAAVLVITLGGSSEDTAAKDLPPAEAGLLVQKVLPKSAVPKGYELFASDSTSTGYKSDPLSVDKSRAAFVCIPQEDTPLPAEAGITAVSYMNGIETGGPNADRPRDQVFLSSYYVASTDRGKLMGQIRNKIKACREEAPTKSYKSFDYSIAPSSVSGATEIVGFTSTLAADDSGDVAVPELVITCQMARVEAVVVRSCALTKKDDFRAPPGGGDDSDGEPRSRTQADANLKKLVAKAVAEQASS